MTTEEIERKFKVNGLYALNPNVKYRGKIHESNLYHCCNWTFNLKKIQSNDYYVMQDTYWSNSDSLHVQITEENINDFELIFEWDQVKRIKEEESAQYERVYKVGVDSGGVRYPKYFVDINAEKSKRLVIQEINQKIEQHEKEIKWLLREKEGIESGLFKIY